MREVELTSGLAGIEDVEVYTTASAIQNYTGVDGEEYSEFTKGIKKEFQKNQEAKRNRKAIRTESKAKAREDKAESKKQEAVAKQLSAKASEEGVKGDIAIAEAIKDSTNIESSKKGLSTGAWVGIGFGALALIGIITYYITKNK